MDLSVKSHEAVRAISVEKFSVKVTDGDVTFIFERDFEKPLGAVTVRINGFELVPFTLAFNNANEAMSSPMLMEHILLTAPSSAKYKHVMAKATERLADYLREQNQLAAETNVCDIELRYQTIIKDVCKAFGDKSVAFLPNLVFKVDIPMEEIAFIEMIIAIEDVFCIEVSDEELDGGITYGRLLDIIKKDKDD